MTSTVKSVPKDAQVMVAILKDMGVSEHEPRLITQMLEFVYRYVTDILDDAKIYSQHANKKSLDVEDVKLAIQCQLDHSFTTPPPRDLLMEIARHKNNSSLPIIRPTGLRLPPDRYCFSATNYRLKTIKRARSNINNSQGITNSLINGPSRFSIQTSNARSMSSNQRLTLVHGSLNQQPMKTAGNSTARPMIRLSTSSLNNNSNFVNPQVNSTNSSSMADSTSIKRKREEEDYDQV